MLQGLAETPALPPPPEIRVPRRVTALDGNCLFSGTCCRHSPARCASASGGLWTPGRQKGVP